jgi:tetratricopeptide (TPR) repeat protein
MDIFDLNDRDGFISQADNYLACGLFEKALDLSRERLKMYPGDADATMVACQSWLGLDDLDNAQSVLASLDKAHLRLAALFKMMGDACLKKGRRYEAITYFQKGMILIPEAFEGRQISQMLADVLDAGPEKTAQDSDDDENHTVSPDFYTITMADLYMKQGHLDMAAEILGVIEKREPRNEIVLTRLREIESQKALQSETQERKSSPTIVGELSKWLNNINKIRSNDPNGRRGISAD